MFRIGQKVVCVDAAPRTYPADQLTVGAIYTVTAINAYGNIRVYEAAAHPRSNGFFFYDRFRPVVEKSTDTGMAILKEILERETVRDPVRATS